MYLILKKYLGRQRPGELLETPDDRTGKSLIANGAARPATAAEQAFLAAFAAIRKMIGQMWPGR